MAPVYTDWSMAMPAGRNWRGHVAWIPKPSWDEVAPGVVQQVGQLG